MYPNGGSEKVRAKVRCCDRDCWMIGSVIFASFKIMIQTLNMEATVMNVFDKKDKVLVVNGGSFGQRFVELCQIHEIPYEEIKLEKGKALKKEQLDMYDGKGFTGFLVNVHETSTGVHYDIEMISEFCKKNGIFLVVDAISSFLADDFDMNKLGVQVMITGSQKALACPPGVSVIVLSDEAVKRVEARDVKCMYLNLKSALKNGERGQTPFTPAVGTLRQINARLKEIEAAGGVESETKKIAELAQDFRDAGRDCPKRTDRADKAGGACTGNPARTGTQSVDLLFRTGTAGRKAECGKGRDRKTARCTV